MGERGGAWIGGDGWAPSPNNNNSWKPPHPPGRGWGGPPPPVPLWEKRFYSEVCGMPWEKLCAIQRFLDDSTHVSILQWDDSAALEALQNAKARFWAEYHGRPCGIPLPDPDMYIDEIDHDAVIDPQLVADLEKQPPAPRDLDGGAGHTSFVSSRFPSADNNDGILPSPNWDAYLEQPIKPTGWGDAAEPNPSNQHRADRVGNTWNYSGRGWDEGAVQNDPWRSSGRNNYVGSNYRRSNPWGTWENRDRNFEPGRRNGRKRDGGGRWGPRYTRPKYQTGAYQLR